MRDDNGHYWYKGKKRKYRREKGYYNDAAYLVIGIVVWVFLFHLMSRI